ncbi:MAG: LytTR family transcriptional regulator [Bacteroidales bacterium]|nr:LytTR family transcriptional regulator [Bacteroidales bacterium]
MSDFLTISNNNELIRIKAESLVYVASDGNYSDIFTRDGEKRTVTLQLGVIEELINKQIRTSGIEFVRIGRSLIVNLGAVHYINPSKQQLVLSDNCSFKFALEASKEALRQLKEYFEQEQKRQ